MFWVVKTEYIQSRLALIPMKLVSRTVGLFERLDQILVVSKTGSVVWGKNMTQQIDQSTMIRYDNHKQCFLTNRNSLLILNWSCKMDPFCGWAVKSCFWIAEPLFGAMQCGSRNPQFFPVMMYVVSTEVTVSHDRHEGVEIAMVIQAPKSMRPEKRRPRPKELLRPPNRICLSKSCFLFGLFGLLSSGNDLHVVAFHFAPLTGCSYRS